MSGNEKHTPLVATPKKKSSHRARCLDCPCHQFQSDDAVTSAVESDARTESLIGWLSGALGENVDDKNLAAQTNLCPNRLQASIFFLNAIRDACRPYLESSAPPPSAISSSPSTKDANKLQPNFSNIGTYKDSFPSLSSMSFAAPPTMLVGRKKSKGLKKNNSSHSSTPSAAAPVTMLVGRKKSKGLNNSHATKNSTNSLNKPRVGVDAMKNSSVHNNSARGENAAPIAKKKVKPVTISLSASSFPPSGPKSLKLEGNISSLPSQDTSEMTVEIPPTNEIEKKATAVESPKLANGCSTGNTTASNDAVQKVENESTNIINVQKLKRMVLIYSTILRAHLAPFFLLELHLLVRLISLSDKSQTFKTADVSTTQPFSGMFQFEHSCQDFAAQTLTALEAVIVNMGHETIKLFVALPALRRQCPGLCTTLQNIIYAGNSALIFEADQKALGSNTNTPHLTLPFDHARDSRHNYRSVDLNRLFKEREELRDSFLYQLRAFQDVRGRLVEHEQAEKHIDSIRYESRGMLKNLSSGNTLWFVNFFCDLLIQIGLVPISETDSEVLKQIGDKKRLQKLHMRFTSKSGQTNKSSRKLRIDHKGPSSTTNTAPEQSFPGHQEFFSIFLRAGDSYKFNVHMKRRLAQIITEMTAVNETKGLCELIAKTQMLAKFLGMLVFSPNWDMSNGSSAADLLSENEDINLPPINIKECIEAAWKQYRLVVVVPWVVQFLGMMKWDEISRRFQYYIDTFTLLWSINHHCLPYQIINHSYHQTNMAMISFQLDALFHDVVGLSPSQNLAILPLPTLKPGGSADSTNLAHLDDLPLWFSKHFLFPSIPHLKDLCELLRDLVQNNGKMATTASAKKVRPNSVSHLGGMDSKFVSRISFSVDNTMSPWSSKRTGAPNSKGGIKERLVDSFFHQHKDLQQLCEMIADRAIKNTAETASQACILPIFRSGATAFEEYFHKSPTMTLEEYMKLLKTLDSRANEEATTLMSNDFDRIIKGALQLLAPPEMKYKVVEIASTLAINHATLKGRHTIHSIISEEKKKLVDEFIRKEKKVKAGVPLITSKRGHAIEGRLSQTTQNST
eukprot:CAMPEP_0172324684 /NCGR_PEP_ID=MMETSP1058-20130122/51971_1 /TAXON_ID=83371 /ORGANISM="Detonula confervacea, Strain CCMP 353" /LENGTH=1077 /DNA_ID=CAMNT_0013041025 /DNA_START=44 /DNA_END=3273 /DNA_ORIENTATION=+